MTGLLPIVTLSLRGALAEKWLQLAGAFAVILLLATVALSDLGPDAGSKVLIDFGLGTIQLFTMLIGVMLAANDLPRELERRTLYVVLSKPIPRYTVIVGKYVGMILALTMVTVLMSAVFYLELWLTHMRVSPWFLVAIGFGLLESAFLVGLAMLLSLLTSPTLALLYTLVVFVLGHQSGVIRAFGRGEGGATQAVAEWYFRLVPNLEALNYKNQLAYALFPSASQLAWSLVFGLCLVVLVLAGGVLVFGRKEL